MSDAEDCLVMIHGAFVEMGMEMSETPPIFYPEAMHSLLFKRLKEAGAFPGHPATVRYEATDDPKKFRRVEL